MNKRKLRKDIRKTLLDLSSKSKIAASTGVCEQLMSIASISLADTIFAYLPLQDEIDLRPALSIWLEDSRTICVPHVSWEDNTMSCSLLSSLKESALTTTRHGIQEPTERQIVPNDSIDVILVPGVAFDANGGRLGRGGGFYDSFLSTSRPPIVIGIAFDEQIVDAVPREPHDQNMSSVITPTKILF